MRVLALAAVITTAAACTPLEFNELITQSDDCHHAVDALWPSESRGWAHRIVDRESGGDRTAQNPRSSAAGCFQLLKLHAHRFTEVGYSWIVDRYNARANTLAALDLYTEQGATPW